MMVIAKRDSLSLADEVSEPTTMTAQEAYPNQRRAGQHPAPVVSSAVLYHTLSASEHSSDTQFSVSCSCFAENTDRTLIMETRTNEDFSSFSEIRMGIEA